MLTITDAVKAHSSIFGTASPRAPAVLPAVGAAATALTATRKVVCLTNDVVITDTMTVSVPGLTIPWYVTDEENAMIDPLANTKESRRLIMTFTFGVGDQTVDYVDFKVARVDLDTEPA